MAKMLYKTQKNDEPKGKPRVYFTCHPEDFDRYFEKIKGDIFAIHDCATYYTEDMMEGFDEAELETDLGQMNLFVVPVTYRLLSTPNRAMDTDIAYAKQAHIPILPFMMESGIDELYSKPEKFGERQYINPNSIDDTEICYQDKLKKHLESTLISDEMAQRVRAAFDAYIFLSYRKKDRKYANELMKLIHKNPECRDVAIWYDEFLTPGESFADSIREALDKSKLFTLLVTPNLLEEPDGKPNYVMAEEYPAAVKAGKEILPAEMEKTDRVVLKEKFRGIPDCADTQDETTFQKQLLQAIQRVAVTANNNDPEHNFLIGLAYLEGIDVEVNKDRGIELITSAAKAELPEAIDKLYDLYSNVWFDFEKAYKWGLQAVCYRALYYGDADPRTVEAVRNFAEACRDRMDIGLSAVLYGAVHFCNSKLLGAEHPDTIKALYHMASGMEWDKHRKLDTCKKVYKLQCKILGKKHADTIDTLKKIAYTHKSLEHYEKAIECYREVLLTQWDTPEKISSSMLEEMAEVYGKLGNKQMEEKYQKAAWDRKISSWGTPDENNYDKIEAKLDYWMSEAKTTDGAQRMLAGLISAKDKECIKEFINLVGELIGIGDNIKQLELKYHLCCEFFGRKDPSSMDAINVLADAYKENHNYPRELELREQLYVLKKKQYDESPSENIVAQEHLYNLHCTVYGEEHSETLTALERLASTYRSIKDYHKELALREQVHATKLKQLGEAHLDTLAALEELADAYGRIKDYQKELELREKLYVTIAKQRGDEHADTLKALGRLASSYATVENFQKSIELREHILSIKARQFGEYSPNLRYDLLHLAACYKKTANHKKTIEIYELRYRITVKQFGEKNPTPLFDLVSLILACLDVGENQRALELCNKAYSLHCQELGEAHRVPLLDLNNLAYAYSKAGDNEKAKEIFETVYKLWCKESGEENKDTFTSLNNLAYTYEELGNREKAKELFEKLYALQRKVLGEEHEDTLRTKNKLQKLAE